MTKPEANRSCRITPSTRVYVSRPSPRTKLLCAFGARWRKGCLFQDTFIILRQLPPTYNLRPWDKAKLNLIRFAAFRMFSLQAAFTAWIGAGVACLAEENRVRRKECHADRSRRTERTRRLAL